MYERAHSLVTMSHLPCLLQHQLLVWPSCSSFRVEFLVPDWLHASTIHQEKDHHKTKEVLKIIYFPVLLWAKGYSLKLLKKRVCCKLFQEWPILSPFTPLGRKLLWLLQNGWSWIHFEILLRKYGRLCDKQPNWRVLDGRWWTNKDQTKLHEDVFLRSIVFRWFRWSTQGSFWRIRSILLGLMFLFWRL